MPFGNSMNALRRVPDWPPFGDTPSLAINSYPIKDGDVQYSSSGMSVMGFLPKSPGDLLRIITEQYEPPHVNRRGQAVRGGKGKRKGKGFFRAHLTWYGVEYYEDDSLDELENRLEEHLQQRPPPDLADRWYEDEPIMRARFIEASANEEERFRVSATERAVQGNSGLLELINAASTNAMLDMLFDNPSEFYRLYFTSASSSDVVVLPAVHDRDRLGVFANACDTLGLKVAEVECPTGAGPRQCNGNRSRRGNYYDMVLGTSSVAVARQAAELRQGPY